MNNNHYLPSIRFAGFFEDWRQLKLRDCCEQLFSSLNPQDTPTKVFTEYSMPAFDNGEIPNVVLGESMNSARKVIDRQCLLINKLNVRKRRIWYIEAPESNAVCSSEFVPVVANGADLRFLKYVVSGDAFTSYLEDCSSGSSNSQKRVTPDVIMSAKIVLPDYKEQQIIGELMAKLDEAITLHRQQQERLIRVKEAMLRKMFPLPETSVPEIRFAGYSTPWKRGKLDTLVQFSKGTGYSKADLKSTGTPIILYGRLYTKYETVITNVDTFADERPGSIYSRGGEVIVPASGETAEDISIASVVEQPGVLLGGDLNIITPPEDIDSTFLAISISNGKPHADMAKMAQGKTVVHLHNTDLGKIDLLYPDYDEQVKISTFFRGVDDMIALYTNKLIIMENMKKSMLQKLFPAVGRV